MKFRAQIQNDPNTHHVTLKVGDSEQSLSIAPKRSGGSSVSGGELLFLALATCYYNDIYRYRAKVKANASEEEIQALLRHTDTVAEIQNTLRAGTPVKLEI